MWPESASPSTCFSHALTRSTLQGLVPLSVCNLSCFPTQPCSLFLSIDSYSLLFFSLPTPSLCASLCSQTSPSKSQHMPLLSFILHTNSQVILTKPNFVVSFSVLSFYLLTKSSPVQSVVFTSLPKTWFLSHCNGIFQYFLQGEPPELRHRPSDTVHSWILLWIYTLSLRVSQFFLNRSKSLLLARPHHHHVTCETFLRCPSPLFASFSKSS